MTDGHDTLWITAYCKGYKVSLTLLLEGADPIAQAAALVDKIAAAGFAANEAGLESGEHTEAIGYVVRRTKVNADGTETPVIDLYAAHDGMKFRFLACYLNSDADVTAFEQATGITLDALTPYDSDAPIERSKDPRKDQRYVVALPAPARAVFTINPDATEENKKAKRRFVRWASTAPAPQPEQPAQKPATPKNITQLPVAADGTIDLNTLFHEQQPAPQQKRIGGLSKTEAGDLSAYAKTKDLSVEQVLAALGGITRLSEYNGSFEQAKAALDAAAVPF